MAVHLIFCRIIAEVVRPLPLSVRVATPRALPLTTLVLPPSSSSAVDGRVDERGRALCLTFCKNCPPLLFSTSAITSVSSSSSTLYLLFLLLLLRLRLTLLFLRLHFLTLRCPVSLMVFCRTRSNVRCTAGYIALYRDQEFPI